MQTHGAISSLLMTFGFCTRTHTHTYTHTHKHTRAHTRTTTHALRDAWSVASFSPGLWHGLSLLLGHLGLPGGAGLMGLQVTTLAVRTSFASVLAGLGQVRCVVLPASGFGWRKDLVFGMTKCSGEVWVRLWRRVVLLALGR